eukprot:1181483-Prorocentrum_minimum.AAC.3
MAAQQEPASHQGQQQGGQTNHKAGSETDAGVDSPAAGRDSGPAGVDSPAAGRDSGPAGVDSPATGRDSGPAGVDSPAGAKGPDDEAATEQQPSVFLSPRWVEQQASVDDAAEKKTSRTPGPAHPHTQSHTPALHPEPHTRTTPGATQPDYIRSRTPAHPEPHTRNTPEATHPHSGRSSAATEPTQVIVCSVDDEGEGGSVNQSGGLLSVDEHQQENRGHEGDDELRTCPLAIGGASGAGSARALALVQHIQLEIEGLNPKTRHCKALKG